jgi:phosphodiesterase/alkaline phosphatase D-like protein
LFDPSTRFDRFVLPYESLYRSRAVRDVLRRLPAYMLLDDHEIDDNWEPAAGADPRKDPHLQEGRRAYLDFQRRATPPRAAAGDHAGDDDPLWFSFARGGFHFFMADTRTEREARGAATIERARIMSEAQFGKLLGWLDAQDRLMPKFIATPSILLPRHLRAIQNGHPASALRSDGWDGYPRSLQRLLAHIADKQIRNVIFLSGDEHLSCVARATVTSLQTGRSVSVYSIHSSALHAPYPFANSIPEDLVEKETFSFAPAGTGHGYRCAVSVERFIPGDGFAVLRVYREGGAWRFDCEFDRAGGRAASPLVRLTLDA